MGNWKIENKGFIIWLSRKFFLRDMAGSPERVKQLHLARSGGQSQRRICFILPARGASHMINRMIISINSYSTRVRGIVVNWPATPRHGIPRVMLENEHL